MAFINTQINAGQLESIAQRERQLATQLQQLAQQVQQVVQQAQQLTNEAQQLISQNSFVNQPVSSFGSYGNTYGNTYGSTYGASTFPTPVIPTSNTYMGRN